MKTKSLKQKSLGMLTRLSFVTAISLFSLTCTAQSAWEKSETKGESTVFKCEKTNDRLFIQNSTNIDPRKNRKEYNNYTLEYSFVRLVSHDAILNAFKKAFTKEEIKVLSELKENITIFVLVGEKGQILNISFALNENTTILPANMEILENELLNNMQFEIIGKKIDYPTFYSSPFRVYFSEVESGEIHTVRNSVNLKAPGEN